MLPLRDSTPTRRFPILNYTIIACTILVFIIQLSAPDPEAFIYRWGFVPAHFSFFNLESYVPIVSSIFLHGGWFHIISNLWFLHIFGDNVEDVLGIFYPIFYLASGIAAVFAQFIFTFGSNIPMVGASGAISGVAGFYYVFFKRHRIETLVPFFGFYDIVELPVWFFLGYWFVIQVFSGIGSLAYVNEGGVAFFAHAGGFVFGYLIGNWIKK